MKDYFRKLAEKFIEYLKYGDYDENFDFILNDGTQDFYFGTGMPHCGFGSWIFVTCMYGDGSATTASMIVKSASMLTFEDVNNIEEDWDDYLDFFTDYYYDNYKEWKPVI